MKKFVAVINTLGGMRSTILEIEAESMSKASERARLIAARTTADGVVKFVREAVTA